MSSSATPFSSCTQSFPPSGSLPVSWLFTSGDQSTGTSSNEYPGLISFRIDWFDLLDVQGTRKSLLQQHSSKVSILRSSAFFMVQSSHPYMTSWTFVDKVMSLLFNMLSRCVIAFLRRSKHLLISWLQSPSPVIFGMPQNKACHCFHCFPIYLS